MKAFAVAVAALLVVATQVAAQPDDESASPWYIAFGLGGHIPYTVDSHSTLPAPDGQPYNWQWQTESNWAMAGSIGYRLAAHWRVEMQSGYYNSGLVSVHAPGGDNGGLSAARPGEPFGLCAVTSNLPSCNHPGGWSFMWSGFANGIYDVLPESRWEPFVGAGVGIVHVEWAAHNRTDVFSGVPGVISADNPAIQDFKNAGTLDRPSQFAVQFLGGASYRVTSRLHLDLTYYHYLTAGLLRWNPENSTPGLPAGAGLRTGNFLGRFQDDSLIISVRYAF